MDKNHNESQVHRLGIFYGKNLYLPPLLINQKLMKNKFYLILLLALPFFTSCKDDEPVEEPPAKGNIMGQVILYDEFNNSVSDSGMTVSVEGTSNFAVTDTGGNFTIAGVLLGNYTLTYEKPGFGTYKMYNVELVSRNQTITLGETPELGMKSKTSISNVTLAPSGTDFFFFISTNPISSASTNHYYRMFFATYAGVNYKDYSNYSELFTADVDPHINTFTASDFYAMGFISGDEIFARAYGESIYSNAYDDSTLGYRVFPNINITTKPAVSFVLP